MKIRFMPLFHFFFFFTNGTNSIAHYNKESRFLIISLKKKRLIQVLGEKATTTPLHPKAFFSSKKYFNYIRLTNLGMCAL